MLSAGNICSVNECPDAFQFNIRVNLTQNIYFALHKAIFVWNNYSNNQIQINRKRYEQMSCRTKEEIYGKVKGDYLKYLGNTTEP